MTLQLPGSSFYASNSMAQGDPLLISHGCTGTRRLQPAVMDLCFGVDVLLNITSISYHPVKITSPIVRDGRGKTADDIRNHK